MWIPEDRFMEAVSTLLLSLCDFKTERRF